MIQHLAFGIVIDDIKFPDGRTELGILGGGGPQTAWGMAAASGDGSKVGVVAQVGSDLNDNHLAPLLNADVNLDGLHRYEGLTPRAWQEIDRQGNRTHIWSVPPPVWDKHLASNWELLPSSYHNAKTFHWGLHPENPKLDFAQLLVSEGRSVCLETFKSPEQPLTDKAVSELVTACIVFSPNWNEAVGICGTADYKKVIARFKECGCQFLALRRGKEGADVWDLKKGTGVRVPSVKTTVVDTVGAGNAFCGALMVTLDEGLEQAAAHGVIAASYLIEQIGLPLHLPSKGDYSKRLEDVMNRIERLTL
jgi:cytidine kinase